MAFFLLAPAAARSIGENLQNINLLQLVFGKQGTIYLLFAYKIDYFQLYQYIEMIGEKTYL